VLATEVNLRLLRKHGAARRGPPPPSISRRATPRCQRQQLYPNFSVSRIRSTLLCWTQPDRDGPGRHLCKLRTVIRGPLHASSSWKPSRLFDDSSAGALGERFNLGVIAEVADGLEAVQKAAELKPDLILLDIGLPTMNGIEAARQIRKLSPESKIVFLSQETSADVVEEALSTGAWGYVVKAKAATQLLAVVEAVVSGTRFVNSL
jgi:CheY-like chemotaxis protein